MSDTIEATDPLTAAKQAFWAQDRLLTLALDTTRAAAAAVISAALAEHPRVVGGVFSIRPDGLLGLDRAEDINGEIVHLDAHLGIDDIRAAFGSRQVAAKYGDNHNSADGIWFPASTTGLVGLADTVAELTAKAARAHNDLP